MKAKGGTSKEEGGDIPGRGNSLGRDMGEMAAWCVRNL